MDVIYPPKISLPFARNRASNRNMLYVTFVKNTHVIGGKGEQGSGARDRPYAGERSREKEEF
jgi:hypothetical protein